MVPKSRKRQATAGNSQLNGDGADVGDMAEIENGIEVNNNFAVSEGSKSGTPLKPATLTSPTAPKSIARDAPSVEDASMRGKSGSIIYHQ